MPRRLLLAARLLFVLSGVLLAAGLVCLIGGTMGAAEIAERLLTRLLAEIVRRPAFPEDKIELTKVAIRRSIASRNDELLQLLVRVARESVYGADSPWARKPEYATVEPITRDDCLKMHRLVYAPNRFILVLYGDFKAADMKKLLTARFSGWKKRGVAVPAMPPEPPPGSPRLVFAPKDDVTQSGILLGHLGGRG